VARVVVFHRGYGCESGCCGHAVSVDGVEVEGSFSFDHPHDQPAIEYAREVVEDIMGAEHVKDLDWDNCLILNE